MFTYIVPTHDEEIFHKNIGKSITYGV